jgi:hypothetical protein
LTLFGPLLLAEGAALFLDEFHVVVKVIGVTLHEIFERFATAFGVSAGAGEGRIGQLA